MKVKWLPQNRGSHFYEVMFYNQSALSEFRNSVRNWGSSAKAPA